MRKGGGRRSSLRCGNSSCPACRLHNRLVKQGAEPSQGSAVRDNGCSLDVRFVSGIRCEFRLDLDVATATYRREHGPGQMTRMCDFAAGGVQGKALRVLLIELKGGAADRKSLEQLQEGLDLIRKILDDPSASIRPEGYLVVDRHTAELKNLLRSNKKRLRFGELKVPVEVRDYDVVVKV